MRSLLFTVIGCMLIGLGDRADAGDLFRNSGTRGAHEHVDEPAVIRRRSATLDSGALERLAFEDPGATTLDLFDDAAFTVVGGRAERGVNGDFNWIAALADAGGVSASMTLVSRSGAVAATIRTDSGRLFQFHHIDDGRVRIEEIAPGLLPDCEAPLAPGPDAQALSRGETMAAAAQGGAPTADVLVLFTPLTSVTSGGAAAVRNRIENAIIEANAALEGSGAGLRFRLIRALEIDYVESNSSGEDLFRLRVNGDGYLDDAHTLRDKYGADIVALVVQSGQRFCGRAYIQDDPGLHFAPYAFSVSDIYCVSDLTLTHEIGHNLGCLHDRDNTGAYGPYDYAYGFRTANLFYRTIMAYRPGTRVPYFSGPDSVHNGYVLGVPEGEPEPAHNARVITNNAQFAAGWRPTSPYIADFNQDDRVNASDLAVIIGVWGSEWRPADLNSDGAIDGADLGILLASWTD